MSVVRQPVSVVKSCMPVSILKSSSQYSVTGSRSCSLGISSSEDTDASGGRWYLDCPTVKVPVTLHRTTDCIRGQERKCRGAEKCQSEVYSRSDVGYKTYRPLLHTCYGTGGNSVKLTTLKNGAGVYSDDDRTQLVKRVRSHEDSRNDTLYGHLDDLEESLGEMRSRGDSIVRFAYPWYTLNYNHS